MNRQMEEEAIHENNKLTSCLDGHKLVEDFLKKYQKKKEAELKLIHEEIHIKEEQTDSDLEINSNDKLQNKEANSPENKSTLSSCLESNKTSEKATTTKAHECNVCNIIFTNRNALKVHRRVHTGERLFKCKYCDETFIVGNDLIIHSRMHTGEKHECNRCKKEFDQETQLREHKCKGRSERPYGCHMCKKAFFTKNDLKKHTRIHIKEKPHECKICMKVFIEEAQLLVHNCVYIAIDPERPFGCIVCKKSFTRKSNVYRHSGSHTGGRQFKCDVCISNYLNVDRCPHIERRTFRCEVCRKAFKLKKNCLKHQRAHTSGKQL